MRVRSAGARPAPLPCRAEPRRTSGVSERPRRVLLVEDVAVNQMLATRILEKAGHRVVVAENGREALLALEHPHAFDIVLMDVQMPEMDGFEAAKAIRALERESGAHIPIIAMTAYAMTGDRERCLEAGMDGYISKPIRARELLEAVDKAWTRPAGSLTSDVRAFDERAQLAFRDLAVHRGHAAVRRSDEALGWDIERVGGL